jgi:DNA-binding transcriptional MerR regulator
MQYYSRDIKKLFGISRQQLRYWRDIGLFSASEKTKAGYYKYGYQDLVELKTLKTLKENGVSTYQIKKAYIAIKKRFKTIPKPFVQKPIIIYGNRIAIVENGKIYDAVTGQMFLLGFNKKINAWIKEMKTKEPKVFIVHENLNEQIK